jgi:hypothetical protein
LYGFLPCNFLCFTKYHVTSKYHHAPKQVWQTRVLIQCRYGLSGVRLFNLMVILFIFLIILNIWIYYTIPFCRFTFCFYRLWQNKWIGGKKNYHQVKQSYARQAISTLNGDPGLSRLFWGVVVFRRHLILGIEMLSKWRLPCIVDRILKSISFSYPT